MSLRLACADFTFPLLPHDDVLRLIAMLGFTGVDVGLFEQRSHLWPSHEYVHPDRSGTLLKAKLNDLGLSAADIFLQMDPDFTPWAINHPEAARRAHARDWFLRTLDYAGAAGARHVTILPGVLLHGGGRRHVRGSAPSPSWPGAWSRPAATASSSAWSRTWVRSPPTRRPRRRWRRRCRG